VTAAGCEADGARLQLLVLTDDELREEPGQAQMKWGEAKDKVDEMKTERERTRARLSFFSR